MPSLSKQVAIINATYKTWIDINQREILSTFHFVGRVHVINDTGIHVDLFMQGNEINERMQFALTLTTNTFPEQWSFFSSVFSFSTFLHACLWWFVQIPPWVATEQFLWVRMCILMCAYLLCVIGIWLKHEINVL